MTAAEGLFASVLTALDRPPEFERHQEVLEATAGFGAPEPSILGHLALEAITDGPLAALTAAGYTPTIAVRLPSSVRERDHAAGDDVLAQLARLGEACDVRVVTSGLTARLLAQEHRATLPAAFSERVAAHREGPPIDDVVAPARETLDPDGRAVDVRRQLAAESGETVAYAALCDAIDVPRARVSQVLGRLEELDLAERFGSASNRLVELSPAGSAWLDALDAELGRQVELDAPFSETGQSRYRPCSPVHARVGEDGTVDAAAEGSAPSRTRYLGRSDHAAAGGTADAGSLTAVETQLPDDHLHTRWVSYDERRDEAVVGYQYATPAMEWAVDDVCDDPYRVEERTRWACECGNVDPSQRDAILEGIELEVTITNLRTCLHLLEREGAVPRPPDRERLFDALGEERRDWSFAIGRGARRRGGG